MWLETRIAGFSNSRVNKQLLIKYRQFVTYKCNEKIWFFITLCFVSLFMVQFPLTNLMYGLRYIILTLLVKNCYQQYWLEFTTKYSKVIGFLLCKMKLIFCTLYQRLKVWGGNVPRHVKGSYYYNGRQEPNIFFFFIPFLFVLMDRSSAQITPKYKCNIVTYNINNINSHNIKKWKLCLIYVHRYEQVLQPCMFKQKLNLFLVSVVSSFYAACE